MWWKNGFRSARRVATVVTWLVVSLGAISGFAQSSSDDPWQRFQFAGNTTFSEAQLRNALVADPDFLLAAHPLGTEAELAGVIRNGLVRGYRDAGFPTPQVQVTPAEEKVLIEIDEGPRVVNGPIEVRGLEKVDSSRLLERLTKPFAPEDAFASFVHSGEATIERWVDAKGKPKRLEEPVWPIGQPAKLESSKKVEHAVGKAFADLGYSRAMVLVKTVVDSARKTVRLVIDVLEEGNADRIEAIEVVGMPESARQPLLDDLGLEPGQSIDRAGLRKIARTLWESGRFHSQRVALEKAGDGKLKLAVTVEPVIGTPPIDLPLDDDAEVLKRAGRWLGESTIKGRDVVIEVTGENATLTWIQSATGWMLRYGTADEAGATRNWAIGWCDRQLRFFDRINGKGWASPELHPRGRVAFQTQFRAATQSKHFQAFNVGFQLGSKGDPSGDNLKVQLHSSPADWLAFAYRPEIRRRRQAGVLECSRGEDRFFVDIDTGEIVHWSSASTEIRFEEGAFDEAASRWLPKLSADANAYRADRPMTSLLAVLFDQGVHHDLAGMLGKDREGAKEAWDPHLFSALKKYVDHDALMPVDLFLQLAANPPQGPNFEIPLSSAPKSATWMAMLRREGARLALKHAPRQFAEGDWPLVVIREASLVMLGRGRFTRKVAEQRYRDPNAGPLELATIAWLLRQAGQTQVTERFAQRLPARFEEPAMLSDLEALLRGRVGQWCDGCWQATASLTGLERKAIETRLESPRKQSVWRALLATVDSDPSAVGGRRALAKLLRQSLSGSEKESSMTSKPLKGNGLR